VVELGSQPVHMALSASQLLGEGLHGQDSAGNAALPGQLDSACLHDPLGRPPPHLRSAPAVQSAGRGSSDGRLPARPAVSPPGAAQPHLIRRRRAAAGRLFLHFAVLDAETPARAPHETGIPRPSNRALGGP
jgi:hypothetical protein